MNLPQYTICVENLSRSIIFYRDVIGLDVREGPSGTDTAIITTTQQHQFLLVGPGALDWEKLIAHPYTCLNKGEKIHMEDPEFNTRLRRLSQNKTVTFQLIDRPWGNRSIEARDPDGFGVSIWEYQKQNTETIRAQTRYILESLRGEVEDLSESQQRWRPVEGEWSISEVVHHMADSNLTVLHAVRTAIATPGQTYFANPYDQNLFATRLRYQERPIEPALKMIEATTEVLLSLVEIVDGAWENTTTTSQGGVTSVETYLHMLALHNLDHLEQIRGVRRNLSCRKNENK